MYKNIKQMFGLFIAVITALQIEAEQLRKINNNLQNQQSKVHYHIFTNCFEPLSILHLYVQL